jgi:hypothetical protein
MILIKPSATMNEKESLVQQADFAQKGEKRAFVGLLLLAALLCALLLVVLYVVPYYGFDAIHPRLSEIMGWLMGGIGVVVVGSILVLVVSVLIGRDVPFSLRVRSFLMKVSLPVLVGLGKVLGLDKKKVQHAFVGISNELVLSQCRNGRPPGRVLLLMPHCLQFHECPVRITFNVENCKRCGKCPIKGLVELSEKYDVRLAVVTGGNAARRVVKDVRPEMVIAVACERDLTSGIQDTAPLPVYGIFNMRPHGPCFDTQVALEHVENVLKEVTALRRPSA